MSSDIWKGLGMIGMVVLGIVVLILLVTSTQNTREVRDKNEWACEVACNEAGHVKGEVKTEGFIDVVFAGCHCTDPPTYVLPVRGEKSKHADD